MTPASQIKILYVLVGILVVLVGYMVYQNQTLLAVRQVGATYPQVSTANNDALAGITVGSSKAVPYVSGVLAAINNASIVVKNPQTGATQTVAITADTQVKIDGMQKTAATQQQELAAYNAKVAELMKDPIKNKAALAAVQLPTTQVISDGAMSDLQVGDTVFVVLSDTASTPTATIIHKDTLNGTHPV